MDSVHGVCTPWWIWRVWLRWWRQGPERHLGDCLWPYEWTKDRFPGATFVLFTWFRHGHREGCWSITCFEQMAFPAPDLGGWPQVPCRWPGNVQSGWGQHSLRDVNKVYMWVLLCRQSQVNFSYIISIPMCPERLIHGLRVLSHTEPQFSRGQADQMQNVHISWVRPPGAVLMERKSWSSLAVHPLCLESNKVN